MNILHDIDASRIKPEKFVAVIEISKGSQAKYELDKATGLLKLDRVLYTSTHYPANYGFIPLTLADDDDPIDVFVYCSQQLQPLCLVECVPIGAVDMVDNGNVDTKIIAVPVGDPTYNSYKSIEEMPKHIIEELIHFLDVYKQLENLNTKTSTFYSPKYAKQAIEKCLKMYKSHKK